MSVHAPSFKAGLQAAADFLRSCGFSNIAPDVVRLKPPRASEKKRAAKKSRAKAARATKAAKREAWADVRARVFERDEHACCACGVGDSPGNPLTGDHFFGRARSESLESVWTLCWICHRQKTDSVPDAATWLLRFIAHAERHGYRHEASKARARLDFVNSRASAGLPFSVEREP